MHQINMCLQTKSLIIYCNRKEIEVKRKTYRLSFIRILFLDEYNKQTYELKAYESEFFDQFISDYSQIIYLNENKWVEIETRASFY
jgi:hypothetical protein